MRYIQESGITNKSVSGDRGAYFFIPKGALTHHRKQRLRYVYLPAADVRFPMERVEVIAYRHIPS